MSALPEHSGPTQQDFTFAFVEAVAHHEQRLTGKLRHHEAHSVSAKIAQVCGMLVAGGHPRQIKRLSKELPRAAEVRYPTGLSPAEVALRAASKLVLERSFRRPLTEMQTALRDWAVGRAVNADNKLRFNGEYSHGRLGDLIGLRTEMLAIGLLSRPTNPGVLALPALPHHEAGMITSHHHYDMLVLDAETKSSEVLAHKVQVKTPCHGLSYLHPSSPSEYKEYDRDITVISGCCEIVDGDDTSYGAITQALRREMVGAAKPVDIDRLDILGESLRTAIAYEQTGHAIKQRVLDNI